MTPEPSRSAATPLCFVSHLESTADRTVSLPPGEIATVHDNRPLLVRYDLDKLGRTVDRDMLQGREPTLWRYRELLPLHPEHRPVSLGEGMSPLLDCPRLAAALDVEHLWIKDESQLPTGSFKARGMTLAVSMANAFGVRRVAVPTAGNAGGALAAYAARAGMECFVFMPSDTPRVNQLEAAFHGARAFVVDGLIHDCGRLVRSGIEPMGWFDVSTLREPYRIEGKKTMGLELAEQLGWSLPDGIFYPTGGGTGLIGMWKAFAELTELGWLEDSALPRMYSCQFEGCAPIAEAFAQDLVHGTELAAPHTAAAGIRVPKALGDFLVLQAVRESGGRADAIAEGSMLHWMQQAARLEGIALCPESASCLGVLAAERKAGRLDRDGRYVVFNTGAAQKYVEVLEQAPPLPKVDPNAPDWAAIG